MRLLARDGSLIVMITPETVCTRIELERERAFVVRVIGRELSSF